MNSVDQATFVFADIAGFTALTEAHGDEHAAELVGQFCDLVHGVLPDYGAESVKSIGDAILIRAPEPASAIRLGTRIAHELMTAHGAPSVRVGMHYGPAIERDGDYFGAAVNLAARVSSVATGGEVLLTSTTGALAGDLDDIVTSHAAATACGTSASRSSCSPRSWSERPAAKASSSIQCAGWSSTRSERSDASPTRASCTSSARSNARVSSPATRIPLRAERQASAAGGPSLLDRDRGDAMSARRCTIAKSSRA